MGGLQSRNLLAHSSGGQKSKTEVLAGVLPLKAMGKDLSQASFLASSCLPASFDAWSCTTPILHVHVASSLVLLCVQISSSSKDTSQIGLGPTLMASFYLNHLFKDPFSKYSHILRYWGLGLQHINLGLRGTQFNP